MNSPPSDRSKQLIITALEAYARDVEDSRAGEFAPSIAKSMLITEIAVAHVWVRSLVTKESEEKEGFAL